MQKSVSENRDKFIGGSDISIIMQLSHFKDRYTLLLEKAGLKEIEQVNNAYVDYGNIMEPKIRQYINTLYQRNFVEDKLEKSDIRCHFDGIDDEMILEIKTTSQVHEKITDYKVYLVQLLFYMMNANKNQGMLAVYERPQDFDEAFDDDRLQFVKFYDDQDRVQTRICYYDSTLGTSMVYDTNGNYLYQMEYNKDSEGNIYSCAKF